jgi:ABC-type Na+ efflux pump permease subunit
MTLLRNAWLVFGKDWLEIRRNWQIILPILIAPLIFSLILPLIIVLGPSEIPVSAQLPDWLGLLVENLPQSEAEKVTAMTPHQIIIYFFTTYFFALLFLIIPLISSTVIAADSFAGEKERRTIEALLATPLTDMELLLGKILVSFIPSMIITFSAFALYSLTVDLATFNLFQGAILLPNALWLVFIFIVSPTVSFAGIGLTVIVSQKVKGFREAQQLSGVLVIPIMAIILLQIGGIFFLGTLMLIILLAGFATVDVLTVILGVKMFRRERIVVTSS